MAARAVVKAAAAVSCWAAMAAVLALACFSHPRYGTWAATYASAVGPSQVPPCATANSDASSSADSAYSLLSELHAAAAASNGPAPGPLLSSAECATGGKAIHQKGSDAMPISSLGVHRPGSQDAMTRVSWLSDHCSPRLPAFAVAYEGRSPITVAGPRRIHTGFLHRHCLTGDIVAPRGAMR